MTDAELAQVRRLACCTFSPGSTAKRFIHDMAGLAVLLPMTTLTPKQQRYLNGLAHSYRKQLGRCLAIDCERCTTERPLTRDDLLVALDAILDGRNIEEYDRHRARWRLDALGRYNAQHKTTFANPYEYATTCAPQSRRAHTLGDIYCRFCGERLFQQVKQPHRVIRESPEAQRHLTICALQVLTEMRKAAKPGHRAIPMEAWW
jgi:hypothetical protein